MTTKSYITVRPRYETIAPELEMGRHTGFWVILENSHPPVDNMTVKVSVPMEEHTPSGDILVESDDNM